MTGLCRTITCSTLFPSTSREQTQSEYISITTLYDNKKTSVLGMPLAREAQHMYGHRSTPAEVPDTEQLYQFPRMDPPYHHHHQHNAGISAPSQGLVRHRNNLSSFSLSSHISVPNRVSTLEAYELMYGEGPAPGSTATEDVERLYETNAVYENPVVTATSRDIIGEINTLTRQLREVDVPRPLAMFKLLFRPSNDYGSESSSWFQALRVWSEIDEIYDSESFDGHRLSIVEHTLNVLILPGLHSDARGTGAGADHIPTDIDIASVVSLPAINGTYPLNPKPVLAIPGLRRLPLPSPFHLKLHVISRLSFNEQGRITRHRDFYDVRDVLALVPGVRTAQWIGTRAAAQGLAATSRLVSWVFGIKGEHVGADYDTEDGVSPMTSPIYVHPSRANALGLHFNEGRPFSSTSRTVRTSASNRYQAPDVDHDAE